MQIIVLYEGKTLRSAVQLFIVYVDDARRIETARKRSGASGYGKEPPRVRTHDPKVGALPCSVGVWQRLQTRC